MFLSFVLAVEIMKLASCGLISPGRSALLLVLEVSKDKKWSVKDWMTTPLSRTISVILTVSHLKIKEPATLSLAHLNGSLETGWSAARLVMVGCAQGPCSASGKLDLLKRKHWTTATA